MVVVTTTWEGAFAKAAGAEDVKVIVPKSVHHAPDYDPKPSDLAAVAKADFVLYAPFEPYAEKIKEAAGSRPSSSRWTSTTIADKVSAEVARLGELFGTEEAAATWKTAFDTEYAKLTKELKAAWPGGQAPNVVAQVFTALVGRAGGRHHRRDLRAGGRDPGAARGAVGEEAGASSWTTRTCPPEPSCRTPARSRCRSSTTRATTSTCWPSTATRRRS